MNRLMVTSLLLLLYIISVSADPQSKITGQVTDSEGAALANSRVLVHWDSSGSTVDLADNIGSKEDVIVVTDASGNYSVSVPPVFMTCSSQPWHSRQPPQRCESNKDNE